MPEYSYEIVSFYGECNGWQGDWVYVVPVTLRDMIDWSLDESEALARQHTVAAPSFMCRD